MLQNYIKDHDLLLLKHEINNLTISFFLKDLTDLLKDEIQGPATFKCSGPDCLFSGKKKYQKENLLRERDGRKEWREIHEIMHHM